MGRWSTMALTASDQVTEGASNEKENGRGNPVMRRWPVVRSASPTGSVLRRPAVRLVCGPLDGVTMGCNNSILLCSRQGAVWWVCCKESSS